LATGESKLSWEALAGRFSKGATLRARAAEEEAEKARAVASKPAPEPDPDEVAVRAWAIRDEATFISLSNLIDKALLVAASNRRSDIHSHPAMAFSEGVCAGLEDLQLKLIKLRTS
jgi:hypothetical protein